MTITLDAKILTADAAHRMVEAAIAKGRELGANMNCAVVDSGGRLLAFLREPGAPLHSIDIAIDKAYSAASFRCSTERLYEAVEKPESLRDNFVARPHVVVFGGGLPIATGGAHVGGIGVSGGSVTQDTACAQAGIDAVLQG